MSKYRIYNVWTPKVQEIVPGAPIQQIKLYLGNTDGLLDCVTDEKNAYLFNDVEEAKNTISWLANLGWIIEEVPEDTEKLSQTTSEYVEKSQKEGD